MRRGGAGCGAGLRLRTVHVHSSRASLPAPCRATSAHRARTPEPADEAGAVRLVARRRAGRHGTSPPRASRPTNPAPPRRTVRLRSSRATSPEPCRATSAQSARTPAPTHKTGTVRPIAHHRPRRHGTSPPRASRPTGPALTPCTVRARSSRATLPAPCGALSAHRARTPVPAAKPGTVLPLATGFAPASGKTRHQHARRSCARTGPAHSPIRSAHCPRTRTRMRGSAPIPSQLRQP